MQISSTSWMKISLKPGLETKVSAIKLRVYPLDNKSRQLVNKTFDKMHHLGCIKFIFKYTPFSFPIFVIWKIDTEGKKKVK